VSGLVLFWILRAMPGLVDVKPRVSHRGTRNGKLDAAKKTHLISPALRGRNSDSSGMQMISMRPTSSASG
jgi:hypothetical protein